MPAPLSLTLIDAHTHIGADLLFYFQGTYPYALDRPSEGQGQARRPLHEEFPCSGLKVQATVQRLASTNIPAFLGTL